MKIGEFKIENTDGNARAGVLQTAHGLIETPVFMPVGTKASVKSLDPDVLHDLGAQIVLGNTYHLYLAPGHELIRDLGGLHQFMQWNKPILTDSGGFQVFSLGMGKRDREKRSENSQQGTVSTDSLSSHLAKATEGRQRSAISDQQSQNQDYLSSRGEGWPPSGSPEDRLGEGDINEIIPEAIVTEEGVEFRSHKDGSKHFFTPEKSIDIQAALGADIIMAFDECPPFPSSDEYYKASMNRTHQWLLRCIAHKKELERDGVSSNQLLFGIVQGGMVKALREESARFVSEHDLPGIAIGGVANGGEDRALQMQQVEWVMPHLPEHKPRYLMGVGTPLDLVEFVARGVDMFDCVLPTRLARNGAVWMVEHESNSSSVIRGLTRNQDSRSLSLSSGDPEGDLRGNGNLKGRRIQLKNAEYRADARPLSEDCTCTTCARFTRAYLHHLFMEHEPLAMQLASVHNLHMLLDEMRQIRAHIKNSTFSTYLEHMRSLWQ